MLNYYITQYNTTNNRFINIKMSGGIYYYYIILSVS